MKKFNFRLPSFKHRESPDSKGNTVSAIKKIFLTQTKWLFLTVLTILPFLLMDVFVRSLATDVRYNHIDMLIPNLLFTGTWISFLVIIPRCFKGIFGKIIYVAFFCAYFFAFITQAIYYPYTDFFFGFNLLQSAEEGSKYVSDVIKNIDVTTLVKLVLVLLIGIFAIVKFPKSDRNHWKTLILSVTAFVVVHTIIPDLLGEANKSLKWDTWKNPRNIYNNFSDRNKNMKICGIFEYSARDLYVTFLKPKEKESPEEIKAMKSFYENGTVHTPNEYSGIFKDKNVIFIQLEGMDSWLVDPEVTPTLCSMMKNSIVFTEHYSYYTGGGSTFNSELAVSTGYITPITFTKNPYAFFDNSFPYALPKMFKNNGYSANAFHMNSGEFYTRDLNYKNWGYDNYYSLVETGDYKDASHQLDSELINNEFFYEKLFQQEQPFMHYMITYTPHTPFTMRSDTGKMLARKLYTDGEPVPNFTEEEVAKLFASETDNMLGLLLKALEDNGLIENTVIVAYADHYLYTLNDKSILEQYKTTENNLINNTPFFIWSYSMQGKKIEKVNSQIDILPTVLNMMGIEYSDEQYLGKDVMDPDYPGYVFFSDYSWYDGTNYVENGEATNNPEADPQYITEVNALINNLIQKNDLTLKYNYFKNRK